ncbi:hypothetical protein AY608_11175 [Acinetobacter terrae]|nr:hypothetical protein AY608_11175 [Acinetobacter terrae]
MKKKKKFLNNFSLKPDQLQLEIKKAHLRMGFFMLQQKWGRKLIHLGLLKSSMELPKLRT